MRFRLTTTAKVLIAVIILAVIGGGIFAGLKTGVIKDDTKETKEKIDNAIHKVSKEDAEEYAGDDEDSVITMDKETEDTINLSLDEWIG